MSDKNNENLDALIWNSPAARREIEDYGRVQLSVPYIPTDLTKSSKAEQEEFWGGYPTNSKTCPTCNLLITAAGRCDCNDDYPPSWRR
jgi:hypothetical protein